MGDKKEQPVFDFSKLNFDFGGGASGFTLDTNSALMQGAMQDIQSKLGQLVGEESGYLESLPKSVQTRVKALRHLDAKYEAAEEDFEKEMRALEIRFHKERYVPLLQRRADIVNGKAEPTEEELQDEEEDEEDEEEGQEKGKKVAKIEEEKADKKEESAEDDKVVGVPDFWLTALQHSDMFEQAITEADADALKYLVDITHEPVDDDSGSFTLQFHFKENPYFTNDVLSKTYHLQGDDSDEVVCESVDSTKIDWHKGKNWINQTKKTFGPDGSFFHFFAPPEVKQGKKASPKIVSQMELDFEMAVTLKEEIIRHAVHWFTGDASLGELGMEGDEDDEDDEDGENLANFKGEDYDSEEDDDFVPQEGAQTEGKPECKQQ